MNFPSVSAPKLFIEFRLPRISIGAYGARYGESAAMADISARYFSDKGKFSSRLAREENKARGNKLRVHSHFMSLSLSLSLSFGVLFLVSFFALASRFPALFVIF